MSKYQFSPKAPAGADANKNNRFNEMDIPSEWRYIPEGAVLKTEFTDAESEAVELDRR